MPSDRKLQTTSNTLIGLVQSNDDEAWDLLWHLYGNYVKCQLRRYGLREADIDDIAQEVFVTVMQRIRDFSPNGKKGAFRAWLKILAYHRLVDAQRRAAKIPGGEAGRISPELIEHFPVPEQDGSEEAEQDAVAEIYRRALALVESEFEPRTINMFHRAAIDETPTREIAEQLGVSPAAVRMAKSRVLHRLRELLGEAITP